MPVRLALTLLMIFLPPVARAEAAYAPGDNLSTISAALDAHGPHVGMKMESDGHATHGSLCLFLHCLTMRSAAEGVVPPRELLPPGPPVVLYRATQWLTEPPFDPPRF